jgi:hypothetical protein
MLTNEEYHLALVICSLCAIVLHPSYLKFMTASFITHSQEFTCGKLTASCEWLGTHIDVTTSWIVGTCLVKY